MPAASRISTRLAPSNPDLSNISAAPRTICARVTTARCCCTIYRTFRALRRCSPWSRLGATSPRGLSIAPLAACATLPPAPARLTSGKSRVHLHVHRKPLTRKQTTVPLLRWASPGPLQRHRGSAVCRYRWSRYCSAISSASRASQVSSPTDSSPGRSRSAHRRCGPRTHTNANPESDNVCHSCSPADDPMSPIQPQHTTLTRGTDRPVRPRTPAPPPGAAVHHPPTSSGPGRVEFGRIVTRRVDRLGVESALPEPTPALECAIPPGTCLHRRPPAVHRTTRESPVVRVTLRRSGRAADLPFPRTGTRRSRSRSQYGASQTCTG